MTEQEKIIEFALAGIKTEQYALLEENYSENKETGLTTAFEFKFNDGDKMIGAFATFVFEQEEMPFIKIEVSCHFRISDSSWEHYLNEEQTAIIFPRTFIIHIAMMTVGTARGILFAKTEGTKFASFIIPTIDVDAMIKEDVEFMLENG